MFFDMKIVNSYKNFYDSLLDKEKEALDKLVKKYPNEVFKYESVETGIGTARIVHIKDKEYNITDYASW
jgi:hypothetical protein